ncbi:cation diffusion facilitator family transporter [Thermodesulfobacteriota bacterium]
MSKTGSKAEIETFALKLSVFGYVFMAILGISFSLLTRSEAIMLDGVYSLISFFMALIARRVAQLVEIPSSETFHFGYAHFEPWLNAVRALLILILCSFALVSAVTALLHDGRPVSPGLGVLYGLGAATGCIVLAIFQRRHSRQANSPLLAVDARNWFVDGVISSGVALTFLAATLLQGTSWSHLIPYVDPVLVTVMTVLLIRIPVATFWENLMEVLQVAPDQVFQKEIRDKVITVVADLPALDVQVKMLKVGRFFYTMVHIVLLSDYGVEGIGDLDGIRLRIGETLRDTEYRLVLDTIFTADEKWVVGEV